MQVETGELAPDPKEPLRFLLSVAMAQAETGAIAPDFEAKDQEGKALRLSDHRGKWVVLFFYPADFTTVCTKEACMFRDEMAAFQGLDAVVIGLSTNGIGSHAAFAKKHDLNYRLVSDKDKAIARAYAGTRLLLGTAKRVTFVIDPEGRIVARHHREFSAASHVEFAKRTVEGARRKR
jgi:peroxiredoxin Q/BCP